MTAIAFAPVRIGEPDAFLAGLYAAASSGKPTLLVVPPFPHEWQRSYRLFALLSQCLAFHGLGSLRFDPYGCGDSSGDDDGFCPGQLHADTRQALAWLRSADAGPIFLLGIRAGALVASSVAAQEHLEWIAWQPVASGADYLATLEDREALELANARRYGARLPQHKVDTQCLLGHRLHAELREQLRAAQVIGEPRFSVDAELPPALSGWIDEIDLTTPFPLPQVRLLAASLALHLGGRL